MLCWIFSINSLHSKSIRWMSHTPCAPCFKPNGPLRDSRGLFHIVVLFSFIRCLSLRGQTLLVVTYTISLVGLLKQEGKLKPQSRGVISESFASIVPGFATKTTCAEHLLLESSRGSDTGECNLKKNLNRVSLIFHT